MRRTAADAADGAVSELIRPPPEPLPHHLGHRVHDERHRKQHQRREEQHAVVALPRAASGSSVAMAAESVWKPLKRFQSMSGVLPAAMSTIIVSPTARPRPIITAENSPLAAAGTMTRTAVCQGVAPAPSDALRRWSGTLDEGVVGDREDRAG